MISQLNSAQLSFGKDTRNAFRIRPRTRTPAHTQAHTHTSPSPISQFVPPSSRASSQFLTVLLPKDLCAALFLFSSWWLLGGSAPFMYLLSNQFPINFASRLHSNNICFLPASTALQFICTTLWPTAATAAAANSIAAEMKAKTE